MALSRASDAQIELLKSIKTDTELLRQEPLETAVTLMSEAERVGPTDGRWAQFLNHAIHSLYRAKSLAASSEEQAVVQVGLACAYLTLDGLTDARHWIDESVQSERKTINALVSKSTDNILDKRSEESKGKGIYSSEGFRIKDLVYLPSAFFTIISGGRYTPLPLTGVSPPSEKDIKRYIEPLQRFLRFANAIEICAAIIWGRPETKVLLLEDAHYMYLLSENVINLPVAG